MGPGIRGGGRENKGGGPNGALTIGFLAKSYPILICKNEAHSYAVTVRMGLTSVQLVDVWDMYIKTNSFKPHKPMRKINLL